MRRVDHTYSVYVGVGGHTTMVHRAAAIPIGHKHMHSHVTLLPHQNGTLSVLLTISTLSFLSFLLLSLFSSSLYWLGPPDHCCVFSPACIVFSFRFTLSRDASLVLVGLSLSLPALAAHTAPHTSIMYATRHTC